jgi:hypothetical protein
VSVISQKIIMERVRPFWGRIAVIDSPVDETELASGLIVPVELDDSPLHRAVVIHHDKHYKEHAEAGYPTTELIPEGTVIYYTSGLRVGDVTIVDADDIWAFEESD